MSDTGGFDRELHARLDVLEERIEALTKTTAEGLPEAYAKTLRESQQKLFKRTERALRQHLAQVQALISMQDLITAARPPLPPTGGWALEAQSISKLIHIIHSQRPGLVVEAGSGSSTIWLGHACAAVGAKLVALEHEEIYLESTRAAVKEHGLSTTVEVRHAALEQAGLEGHSTPWYALSKIRDLTNIGLLLIDGPPTLTGPAARYPAFPLLAQQLADNAVVVLDDYERRDEQETLKRWLDMADDWEQQDSGISSLGMLRRKKARR